MKYIKNKKLHYFAEKLKVMPELNNLIPGKEYNFNDSELNKFIMNEIIETNEFKEYACELIKRTAINNRYILFHEKKNKWVGYQFAINEVSKKLFK